MDVSSPIKGKYDHQEKEVSLTYDLSLNKDKEVTFTRHVINIADKKP